MVYACAIIWGWGYSIIDKTLVHHFCSFLMALITASSTPTPSPLALKRSKENSVFDRFSLEVMVPRRWGDDCRKEVEMMAVDSEEEANSSMESSLVEDGGGLAMMKHWRRPPMLVIPDLIGDPIVRGIEDPRGRDLEVEVDAYCMASRKGTRMVMEDGYQAITNIANDPKEAYFGVFDGHGGRAAVDFVCEKLGKNIISAIHENHQPEYLAIRTGYLTTDHDFLSLNIGSGVCTATVLIKDGELHAANVGDCRVVLSRNGKAQPLTSDHRPSRIDERQRIENTGGIVSSHNGVCRVEKTLSISRAIGDLHMKEWIISEPEIRSVSLTQECEFAILATDGLWDKVTDQEAVDMILNGSDPMESCKTLIDLSSRRGSRDDITVMVIHLQKFLR